MNLERLTKVFCETLDVRNLVLTPELNAKEVPTWDSFNHINLVIAIETEFGLKFSTGEISALRNVGDLVKLMQRKGVQIEW